MGVIELKPCPFCGGVGETRIEGKGAIWRGTKGYGEPTSWQLTHFCRNQVADEYVQSVYTMRGRSDAQLVEAWNTRAPNPDADIVDELRAALVGLLGSLTDCDQDDHIRARAALAKSEGGA